MSNPVKKALRLQKRTLRTAMLQKRSTVSTQSVRSQSEIVTRALIACPEFQQSSRISCYLSMEGEFDTSYIINEILTRGKELFVPCISSTSPVVMEMLRIYSSSDLASLIPKGPYGIREPDALTEYGVRRDSGLQVGLDMIVMPGVAFDRSLHRLGYGKGFYDRFIALYGLSEPSRPPPFLIAPALKESVLASDEIVPTDETDFPLDALVCEAFDGLGILRRAAK